MLTKDIKRVNEYLASLSHYNREVAECWYRVRDFASRIIDVAEEEIEQRTTVQGQN